jgi:hypothetical protein
VSEGGFVCRLFRLAEDPTRNAPTSPMGWALVGSVRVFYRPSGARAANAAANGTNNRGRRRSCSLQLASGLSVGGPESLERLTSWGRALG